MVTVMQSNEITLPSRFKAFLHLGKYRYKCAYGGRGGGKSWGIARALIILAASRTLRVLCAREIQNSIKESVHKLLVDQIDDLQLNHLFTITDTKISSKTGSEFIFSGIRSNITKIKSMEGIDICWIEEAEKVSKASWEVLIPTIRKPESEIWLSFNPSEITDPTYEKFILNTPPDTLLLNINWQDNPWFPESLRKEKDYLYRVSPDDAAHVWGGQCKQNSNAQVLKDKYTVEWFEPKPYWNGAYYGADWGFSVDPTTLIECYEHERILYIHKETYGIGVETDYLPQLFDRLPLAKTHVIRADNARPETISYMKRNGYPNIEAVDKWAGSVEDGISKLRSFERIVIHPDCRHTIEEARLWSYKTDRLTGDVLPVLVDAHNHCWDAIRYALQPIIKRVQQCVIEDINPYG